jgi:hypothetical protein
MAIADVRGAFEAAAAGALRLDQITTGFEGGGQILTLVGIHRDGTPFSVVTKPFAIDSTARAAEVARDLVALHTVTAATGLAPAAAANGGKPMANALPPGKIKPKPGDQLADLIKGIESGALRGVVARALGSLGAHRLACASLNSTLVDVESATLNATKLDEYLRGELQAPGDNGAPATAADVLGNSSASSQGSPDKPAPPAGDSQQTSTS